MEAFRYNDAVAAGSDEEESGSDVMDDVDEHGNIQGIVCYDLDRDEKDDVPDELRGKGDGIEDNPDNYKDGAFRTDRRPTPASAPIFKGMRLLTKYLRKEDDFVNGMLHTAFAFAPRQANASRSLLPRTRKGRMSSTFLSAWDMHQPFTKSKATSSTVSQFGWMPSSCLQPAFQRSRGCTEAATTSLGAWLPSTTSCWHLHVLRARAPPMESGKAELSMTASTGTASEARGKEARRHQAVR